LRGEPDMGQFSHHTKLQPEGCCLTLVLIMAAVLLAPFVVLALVLS